MATGECLAYSSTRGDSKVKVAAWILPSHRGRKAELTQALQ